MDIESTFEQLIRQSADDPRLVALLRSAAAAYSRGELYRAASLVTNAEIPPNKPYYRMFEALEYALRRALERHVTARGEARRQPVANIASLRLAVRRALEEVRAAHSGIVPRPVHSLQHAASIAEKVASEMQLAPEVTEAARRLVTAYRAYARLFADRTFQRAFRLSAAIAPDQGQIERARAALHAAFFNAIARARELIAALAQHIIRQ